MKEGSERPKGGLEVRRVLLLDLEATQTGALLKIGAVLGEQTFERKGRFEPETAWAELDRFAAGAECLAGHNLFEHDRTLLEAQAPRARVLSLPVVDTLYLSPICFPENPYHRLVKDYKLVSASVNNPVDDARLAGTLLADEIQALQGMAEGAPAFFRCLRFLIAADRPGLGRLADGMRWVFNATGGPEAPDESASRAMVRELLGQMACRTGSLQLRDDDFGSDDARWSLAYVLTWLRVAGASSVLPPWVRRHHRQVEMLLARLREVPCDHPECGYCREVHDPETQLKKFFGFDGFRATPKDRDDQSLQRKIVLAGMRGESHLAIMPTGGGKSLCFQLPALVRGYRRGQLTIVVSPLQALMKDQVDGLVRRTQFQNVAALSGLLTSPERAAVLRGIKMGGITLLYVSPEQLRSKAFKDAIKQREIGCWVMDEVHCLSKWGHDFRPDYLYVGRFIREIAQAQACELPSIACFTATAKRDVIDDITDYFRGETGTELIRYEGGVERDNLTFTVKTVAAHTKLPRINEFLQEHLAGDRPGTAIVFRATRQAAEETADFLKQAGWSCEHFHAGLAAPLKKQIQDAFLAGQVRVICATNAFGMGIDKDDVRLVIHGDTPGSLENYLQEAGRAGRDRNPAECVLLYDEEDCEQQFRIGSLSQLSRQDIAQILRGLRKASRQQHSDEVVITTGELLRDEDVDTSFDLNDQGADTKVRAAVSWLERAGFIERNDNVTNVIQARLLVKSLDEARERLKGLALSEQETSLWLAVVREMMNAGQTDMLSVDQIAALPEFMAYQERSKESFPEKWVRETGSQEYLSKKVLKVLGSMTSAGVLKKDTLLTAFVRYKVADHSGVRFERIAAADRELIKLLAEEEPDPEGWLKLNLRLLNDGMMARGVESSPEMLRLLLQSMSQDGRGFSGQSGSLDVLFVARDAYRVRVRRDWGQIAEIAEKRRRVAGVILQELLKKAPEGTPPRNDLLVEFTFEGLQTAVEQDLTLRSDIRDMQAAIERGLMFLHEQNVIILQKGLAIFRSAMTVRVLPESEKQRYRAEHYEALEHHYRERTFQVHVMNEYARYGLDKIKAALDLVLAYFSSDKETFIQRFFGDKRKMLEQATTARSYRAIVDALGNRDQIRIVTQPASRNLLILAGPGAGKTRTVVHRCAYLLRVKRVRARSILVCCFNHKAAVELKRRLVELVGRDALGVMIQTYHGLALRILGVSAKGMMDRTEAKALDFDGMIQDAVQVLRGEKALPGVEPDEVRDRLLAGFEHILVDEYQDIDERQYEMIGAIAGRHSKDSERKLAILAVGDDDQSIYQFRGANVEFIRRFQRDYEADVAYLVENYRSPRYIIEAGNRVIARNHDRMKTDKPIQIDQGRRLLPAGGVFGDRDPLTRGRVALVEVGDAKNQAVAMVRELKRLQNLGATCWDDMAVLSRKHEDLAWVRTEAEREGIPVAWPLETGKLPGLHRIRELWQGLAVLKEKAGMTLRASDMKACVGPENVGNSWSRLLHNLLDDWKVETDDEPTPISDSLEYLFEALTQRRRDERWGRGVVFNTIHAAKGCEYNHVLLCGKWNGAQAKALEEERRVLYVGMTRARLTLSIFKRMDVAFPFSNDLVGPCFAPRRESSDVGRECAIGLDYHLLGLDSIFLDYAGSQPAGHAIHRALTKLQTGELLGFQARGNRLFLTDSDGLTVACLSAQGAETWRTRISQIEWIKVVCMVTRLKSDSKDEQFQQRLCMDVWELPICEIATRAAGVSTVR